MTSTGSLFSNLELIVKVKLQSPRAQVAQLNVHISQVEKGNQVVSLQYFICTSRQVLRSKKSPLWRNNRHSTAVNHGKQEHPIVGNAIKQNI